MTDTYEDEAARLLPCGLSCGAAVGTAGHHWSCPAHFRPAVAAKLREMAEIEAEYYEQHAVLDKIVAELLGGGVVDSSEILPRLKERIAALEAELTRITDGHQRMNKMLTELWQFMDREELIDEQLADEAGPPNDHESRGRLNIVEIAERVMLRQARRIAALEADCGKLLLAAERDALAERVKVLMEILWDAACQWASYDSKEGTRYSTMGLSTLDDIFATLGLEPDREYSQAELLSFRQRSGQDEKA